MNQHIVVPEAQDTPSCGFQNSRSLPILLRLFSIVVLTAVQFYGEHDLDASEIQYETAGAMLPAEFYAELAVAQARPYPAFCICLFLA